MFFALLIACGCDSVTHKGAKHFDGAEPSAWVAEKREERSAGNPARWRLFNPRRGGRYISPPSAAHSLSRDLKIIYT